MKDEDKSISPSTEMELLLCSARTHLDEKSAARILRLSEGPMDWPLLLRLAQRHGLLPLLYRHLDASCPDLVPVEVLDKLRSSFYSNALRNHSLTQELCRILGILKSHNIEAIPYKGPVLASMAYGNISLRQFSDLDLMVKREQMPSVSALLQQEGYSQQWSFTPRQERFYLKTDCERLFSKDGSIFLDVHWAAVRSYFPLKLSLESMRERLINISLEECHLQSFAPEDHLLILCLHASKDLWAKLVWVSDIAELLRSHPQMDWNALLSTARDSGTLRMLLLGLSLSQGLLGADLPDEISREVRADAEVRVLAELVQRRLLRKQEGASGSLDESLFYLRLFEGPGRKMSYLFRYWLTTNPADYEFIRLPDFLFPLYRLVRPLRLILKHSKGNASLV